MAEHIIDLLTDDTKRERFGKAARDFVEREYDYPTEMRKVETLYHALTAEAGGL
jgi:glycosyltransferase involved in cell wall biosynthesis